MISAVINIILSLATIALVISLIVKKKMISGGVRNIPPTYIETMNNTPIRFRIDDKTEISIQHFSCLAQLHYIAQLQAHFDAIIKEDAEDVLKVAYYIKAIDIILAIAQETQKVDKKTQIKFKKKCIEDSGFFIDICGKILDYWVLVKKKAEMLAQGKTVRLMLGADFSQDLWARDILRNR